jgi:hypothetical protein
LKDGAEAQDCVQWRYLALLYRIFEMFQQSVGQVVNTQLKIPFLKQFWQFLKYLHCSYKVLYSSERVAPKEDMKMYTIVCA